MSARGLTRFRVGAWSFIVVGVGHLGFELVHQLHDAPSAIDTQLRAQTVAVRGMHRNLFALHLGFSIAMALFVIACGALGLVFARAVPDLTRRAPGVVWLNLALALVGLALAIWAFPPPPIVAFAVASLAFGLALGPEPRASVS